MIRQYSVTHGKITTSIGKTNKERTQIEIEKLKLTEIFVSLNANVTWFENGDIIFTSDKRDTEVRKILSDSKLTVNNRNQNWKVYEKLDVDGNPVNDTIEKYDN